MREYSLTDFINNAMTARRELSSVRNVSQVDGLLMNRLSVIARNRGMGGLRLGPYQSQYKYATFVPTASTIVGNG